MLAGLALWGGSLVEGHPGAFAEGRATCGDEYSKFAGAYDLPDVKEAWFLRRISTCEKPEFWMSFDVAKEGQPIYIATISPELSRFTDKLVFNAILYGPGVKSGDPGLFDVPAQLPAGITRPIDAGSAAAYMKSPTNLSTCDFVDTNPVMKSYSDVIGGRCMEKLKMDDDYKDALQAGATGFSWWLYSFNHVAAKPGRYHLQSWLTDKSTGAVAQGKYEITIGPHTWFGYAAEVTQKEAQAQGTECSCAPNAIAYKETYLERLGGVNASVFNSELPGGSCDANPAPASKCITQKRVAYLSTDTAVEWAGIFDLRAGRTYLWTFRAYYKQPTKPNQFEYPDPGMWIFVTTSNSLDGVSAAADTSLTAAADTDATALQVRAPSREGVRTRELNESRRTGR